MKLIVATDVFGAIGAHNKIPWHVPEDLKYFKEKTSSQAVIMGRKTSESLRPFFACGRLPNRRNIIISSSSGKNTEILKDGISQTWTSDVETILNGQANLDQDKTWVIGGETIYKLFLPLVTEIYLTEVFTIVDPEEADAYFKIDREAWVLTDTTEVLTSVSRKVTGVHYKYVHQVWRRK